MVDLTSLSTPASTQSTPCAPCQITKSLHMHAGPRGPLLFGWCTHYVPTTSHQPPATFCTAPAPPCTLRAWLHCHIWTCPSIHVSLCLEEFSPQTSPSGTNYPMVGVLSMCPPHHFSQFPTSRHPCRPAQTRFFAYLALHGLRTTLCTLLRTSMHLHAPPHTSAHPCATFVLHFPGLVTLIGPSILTLDPFGYPGQLSPSATGHNAHPRTSVESSPYSSAPIQPIHFSPWACTTHIAIQGPCPAGSPLPKWHIFFIV